MPDPVDLPADAPKKSARTWYVRCFHAGQDVGFKTIPTVKQEMI